MHTKDYLSFIFSQLIKKEHIHYLPISSIFKIPYNQLYKEGVRLLLFDVDETLCGDKDDITKKSLTLLKKLQQPTTKRGKFNIGIVTNGNRIRRAQLREFFLPLKIPVCSTASKPNPKSIHEMLKIFKKKPQQTIMVGDKVGMDAWAGYRAKLYRSYVVNTYSSEFGGSPAHRLERFIRWLGKKISTHNKVCNHHKKTKG